MARTAWEKKKTVCVSCLKKPSYLTFLINVFFPKAFGGDFETSWCGGFLLLSAPYPALLFFFFEVVSHESVAMQGPNGVTGGENCFVA